MLHRDHLVRQINRLTQVLAQVIFRKQQGQHEKALDDIRRTGELFLGLDLQASRMLTSEALQEALRVHDADDAEQTALIAELLYHQGDCFAVQGLADQAEASFRLALHLYLDLFASRQTTAPADLTERLDTLLRAIDLFTLPSDTLLTVFLYLDETGKFARAEDILFHLADTAPSPALFETGMAFFKRLLKETPYRRLEAGGLPYQEAVDGLNAFKQKWPRGNY